jgi:hypothetical protein
MRSGLIDLLVPDRRDRRAIDETIADWRMERSQATGAAMLGADVRGAVAFARTLAACTFTAFTRPDIWRYLGATVTVSMAIGVALAIEPVLQWGRASATMPLSIWLSLLPGALTVGLLLSAAAGFGLRPGRELPVATAAFATAAIASLATGWVVPAANQQFRELTAIQSRAGYWPPPGPAELPIPELVSRVVSGEAERLPVRRELGGRVAFVGMWVALVGFGEAVRRRLADHCYWWLTKVSAFVGGAALLWLVLEAAPTLITILPPEAAFYAFEFHVDRLATVPVILLLTWWLSRRTAEPEPAPRNPGTPEPRNLASN